MQNQTIHVVACLCFGKHFSFFSFLTGSQTSVSRRMLHFLKSPWCINFKGPHFGLARELNIQLLFQYIICIEINAFILPMSPRTRPKQLSKTWKQRITTGTELRPTKLSFPQRTLCPNNTPPTVFKVVK